METTLTFIFLLQWCVVCCRPGKAELSFSVAFSEGTLLQVDGGEEQLLHGQNQTAGPVPSVQIFSSAPGFPPLLVCIVSRLSSPRQDVLWWLDDTPVTSSGAHVSWAAAEGGGAYVATAVWAVPAADWGSRSSYWCGTVQDGRVHRQRLCSQD
ncbi:hypothetical protein PFLUV_G00105220 [Perca fluviatilis]|uniref:Ig-like domain-containing protein n=1 Tax=Perca fluviatilis TaxID=8168 RepID=A0A6A5ESZ6_PERFL|nr:hypothetical protein PFLUV_G00105220 [Perca fluviatilis]